jgi:hypothetical protein
MNCNKCYHCVQVSASDWEVKCRCAELGYNGVNWEKQPDYCKHYLNKKYTIVKKEDAN